MPGLRKKQLSTNLRAQSTKVKCVEASDKALVR
jgi:hypothetical protein